MPIIDVKEECKELSGSVHEDTAEFPARFTVKFDNKDLPRQRPILALNGPYPPGGPTVPQDYEQMDSSHPWLFVINRQWKFKGPFLIEIDITYSNRSNKSLSDVRDPYGNPLDAPADVGWGFVTENEPVDWDMSDPPRPIMNSAGDIYDNGIVKSTHLLCLHVTRNQASYDAYLAADLIDSMNNDAFLSFQPWHALCTEFSGEMVRAANLLYWKVHIEVVIRTAEQGSWMRRVRDEGYNTLITVPVPGGGFRIDSVRIEDGHGNPIIKPRGLDVLGNPLPKDAPAHWLYFQLNKIRNFSALGI